MSYTKTYPVTDVAGTTEFVDGSTVLSASHMNTIKTAIRADESYLSDSVDPVVENAVLATAQTLTPAEQAQARGNIGAVLRDVVTDWREYGFTNGGYIKTDAATVNVNSPVVNNSYRYAVAECKGGDYVFFNVFGAGAARSFAFVAEDGTRIGVGWPNNRCENRVYIAPAGSKWVVANSRVNSHDSGVTPPLDAKLGIGIPPAVVMGNARMNAEVPAVRTSGYDYPLMYGRAMISSYTNTFCVRSEVDIAQNRSLLHDFVCCPAGYWLYANPGTVFSPGDGMRMRVAKRTLAGEITVGSEDVATYTVTEPSYYHFSICKADGSDIAESEFTAIAHAFTVTPPTQYNTIWRNEWFIDASHRGFQAEAPQGTLPAFVRAKYHGYNAVECDLRITSDGKYVVHHNAGMPSDSSYLIAEHTLDELRANANMGTYNGEAQQILEFLDVVKIAKRLDMWLLIELKATFTQAQVAEIMNLAQTRAMGDRVIWQVSYIETDADWGGIFRAIKPDCYILCYNAIGPEYYAQFSPADYPGRTLCLMPCYHVIEGDGTVHGSRVRNLAAIGVRTMIWSTEYLWNGQWSGLTEQQIKDYILQCVDLGVAGTILDKWSEAELVRESYAKYLY